MKNFFIPHEGNNFLPHALHPKRLAFYTFVSLAIKSLIIILVAVMPITAWLTPDVLTEQAKKIIQLTNQIRTNLNLPALTENSQLDQAAYDKAQDMLFKQYFSHIGPDNRKLSDWLSASRYDFSVAGENLAMGFSSAEDVVNAWTASKTHYANMVDKDFKEIGVGMASGLYEKFETTLVAQYFGAPAEVKETPAASPAEPARLPSTGAPKEVKGESVQAPSASTESGNGVETKPSAAKSLGKKPVTPEPLAKPSIVAPSQTYTNRIDTNFEIFSPKSELIKLFDNGQEIFSSSKNPADDYFKFDLRLPEGLHKLEVWAYKGEVSAVSDERDLMIDLTAPKADQSQTQIVVNDSAGLNKERVVMATAYLSPDTASARVSFGSYQIELKRDENDVNKWSGSQIIFDDGQEHLFDPVVLASLTAADYAGNQTTSDINWKNAVPVKTSLLNQYFFLKGHQSAEIKKIFDISSIYYLILLSIASISLALNIFVNIHKQHAHVIVKTVGLICLLTVLLIL